MNEVDKLLDFYDNVTKTGSTEWQAKCIAATHSLEGKDPTSYCPLTIARKMIDSFWSAKTDSKMEKAFRNSAKTT